MVTLDSPPSSASGVSMRCVQVGPKEFVKAVLRHHSDKNPVQRCLDLAANEVLAFRADAFDASEWSAEDKGEALNMALAAVHLQCIDAGVCYAQTGLHNYSFPTLCLAMAYVLTTPV